MIAAIANEGRQLVTEGLIRNFDIQTNGSSPAAANAARIYDNSGAPPAAGGGGGVITMTQATVAGAPAFFSLTATGASGAYIVAPPNSTNTSEFIGNQTSIACWFVPPASGSPTSYALMGLNAGGNTRMTYFITRAFGALSGFSIQYSNSSGNINTSTVLTTNLNAGWNMLHVNMNFGASSEQVYLNGILLGSFSASPGSIAGNNPNFTLRQDANSLGGGTAINMGGGLVYNRLLLPGEIQQNYLYYADRYQRYY
jgi:hypothetical protein